MFKVSITNRKQNLFWEAKFESQELAQEWLNKQIGKHYRMPEREIGISAEEFQELDASEIKEVKEDSTEGKKNIVLNDEFSYEIIDLNLDAEYVKNETMQKRIKEYPSLNEKVDALLSLADGDDSAILLVNSKIRAINQKYPIIGEVVK